MQASYSVSGENRLLLSNTFALPQPKHTVISAIVQTSAFPPLAAAQKEPAFHRKPGRNESTASPFQIRMM